MLLAIRGTELVVFTTCVYPDVGLDVFRGFIYLALSEDLTCMHVFTVSFCSRSYDFVRGQFA